MHILYYKNYKMKRAGSVDYGVKSLEDVRWSTWHGHVIRRDEDSRSRTLWREEIRKRCEVVDMAWTRDKKMKDKLTLHTRASSYCRSLMALFFESSTS